MFWMVVIKKFSICMYFKKILVSFNLNASLLGKLAFNLYIFLYFLQLYITKIYKNR